MKPFVLSTIMFGILSSGLAIASELEGHEVSEEGRRSISHHLSKRDVALFGNFPGLGGQIKRTKCSRPGQKGGAAPAAASARKVAPAGQQKLAGNRALLQASGSDYLDSVGSDHELPLGVAQSVEGTSGGRESPSSLAESDSLKKTDVSAKIGPGSSDLVRRALFRRSLFGWKSLATRELTSGSSETESTVSHFQDSHRKLGEFPALGGLKGTVSAQEAEKIIEVRTSSSSSAVRSASVETQSPTVPLATSDPVSASLIINLHQNTSVFLSELIYESLSLSSLTSKLLASLCYKLYSDSL
ncbi:hypothetical protein PSTT_09973 [Puccinia striiformis]|uniref:Uncharacterized protein n=1 Tax=Puccinia striiformis TaxID=27350 RepID=A0A2S4V679_9BASI|nr:hypothetical protein PSTT_09973 [Puccinia striiformis]